MRTTLNIDPELLKKAQELTKIEEKTSLIHEGLRALIAQSARERLIALGGSDKKAKAPKRRRTRAA
ncbi:MAG TPA: type II toxin-antitoxin system VapB family antitoxin [Bdellovibrio sp.]|nr:type II toxin-antitoxin system VapB family antitoxin [Bdellovibrio sp.]